MRCLHSFLGEASRSTSALFLSCLEPSLCFFPVDDAPWMALSWWPNQLLFHSVLCLHLQSRITGHPLQPTCCFSAQPQRNSNRWPPVAEEGWETVDKARVKCSCECLSRPCFSLLGISVEDIVSGTKVLRTLDKCDLGSNPTCYGSSPKDFTAPFMYGSEGPAEPDFCTWPTPSCRSFHVLNPWRGRRLCSQLSVISKAKGFLSCPRRSEYGCEERIVLIPFSMLIIFEDRDLSAMGIEFMCHAQQTQCYASMLPPDHGE